MTTITTVTLNPSFDRTIHVPGFRAGALNRAAGFRLDPGGKGINVSKVCKVLGHETVALGFLGGPAGDRLAGLLHDEQIPADFISISGETRTNLKIIDPDTGEETEINEPGPVVAKEEIEQLVDRIREWLPRTKVLVLSGSVPPGVPDDIYARIIQEAGGQVKIILDAPGEALRAGLAARPYLVKPNLDEARWLLGRPVDSVEDAAAGAREIRRMGAEVAVISLGPKGAVIASLDGCAWIMAPPVAVKSTVGAGDAMVAALAVSLVDGLNIREAAILASGAAVASVLEPGTRVPTPENIQRIASRVHIEFLNGGDHLDLHQELA